jgi:hypothetical protein
MSCVAQLSASCFLFAPGSQLRLEPGPKDADAARPSRAFTSACRLPSPGLEAPPFSPTPRQRWPSRQSHGPVGPHNEMCIPFLSLPAPKVALVTFLSISHPSSLLLLSSHIRLYLLIILYCYPSARWIYSHSIPVIHCVILFTIS